MSKIEKALLGAGIGTILITNVIGAVKDSASWIFIGVLIGLFLCGYSYVLGNRRGFR